MEEKTTTKSKLFGKRHARWLAGLIGMFFILFGTGLQAQEYESLLKTDSIFSDTIDHLIITEWRGDSWQDSYIELTNMGDTAIDLRKMAVRSLPGNKNHWNWDGEGANNTTMVIVFDSLKLSVDDYTLEPNEVFLMAPHYDALTDDGKPIHRPELVEMADYVGYKIESSEPNDSSSYGERFFRQWSSYPIGVFVAARDTSHLPPFYKQWWVLVDNINGDRDPTTGDPTADPPVPSNIGLGIASVAGFPEATGQAVLVRKHTVTKGTIEGGWTAAASDDITTSEWIPIKHDNDNPGGKVFKTAGNHGNFTMDITGGPGVTVDLTNGTIEVPWGALRGEDIIDSDVILGDGMAWTYRNYSEEGDSLLNINDLSFNQIAMPGDVLKVYACGDELETVELTIQYATHAGDIVKAYPTHILNDLGEWAEYFYVTEDEPVIDTIGNVPFATRIDTLMKYVEVAPNSTWEIVFVDGEERVDLMDGDILLITGSDGSTTKQYHIDVLDYEGNPESRLSTITWPDISLQGAGIPYYLQNGWASGAALSDTLPGFSPSKLTYMIKLAEGTENVPAFSVTPLYLNAFVSVDPATDLYGSVENRTTTITVTSEDSSAVSTYSILFEVHSSLGFQEFEADPFFSTRMMTINTRNAGLELFNPGNVDLDLSNYLIVKTNASNDPIKAIQDTLDYFARYNKYIPGYVYKSKDTTAWKQTKDYTLTKGGANIKSTIGPGDVFVMANMHDKANKWWKSITHTQEIDVIFHPKEALVDPFYPEKSIYIPEEFNLPGATKGQPVGQQDHVGYNRGNHSYFLFRIDNPEILAGTKPIYDTLDFTLIDAIGDPVNSPGYILGSWDEYGDSARIWTASTSSGNILMIREPDIFKGVSTIGEGISEDHEICQWIVGDEDYWPEGEPGVRWSGMTQHFGTHIMDNVAIYVSTITSASYIVSTGFEGDQDVKGVVTGTTVEAFTNNVTKADDGQGFQFRPVAGGADLVPADVIMNGDTLIVAAADSSNFTKYILEVTDEGLKSDATLNSNAYAVADAGATGTISGVTYGVTVQDVLLNVTKDADAKLAIINGKGELVGLNAVTADGDVVPRTADKDVYFKVTAQDKVTSIVYQIVPTLAATDAYILSDVYDVAEDVVSGLTFGISVEAFFNNIITVGGDSYIEDVAGFTRSIGGLNFDDKVVVVSTDGTVTMKYRLGFLGTVLNVAPMVEMPASVEATVDVSFNVAATVSDDGLPEAGTMTYTWSVISGDAGSVSIATADAASTDVTISAAGSYTLQIVVNDGELESTGTVDVSAVVGIARSHQAELTIYPNPTSDKVFVVGLRINSDVSVYNIAGSVVDQFNANDGRQFIELGEQPSGTYFIRVTEENGAVSTGKVIKK
jgi:hypothetical protein